MVGDGSGLHISSICSTLLSAPHSTLKLRNALHVLAISQNPIPFTQFTNINNCYFEFHPSHFVIKDL